MGNMLTVANLFVSLALLVVTTLYLFSTMQISNAAVQQTDAVKRQTDIMNAQNQINFRPYVAIVRNGGVIVQGEGKNLEKFAEQTTWFEPRLYVENVGNVMVKVVCDELSFEGQGGPIKGDSVLMPKQQFFYRNTFKIPPTNVKLDGVPGHGRFRISYWSPADPATKYFFSVGFKINANRSISFDDENAS